MNCSKMNLKRFSDATGVFIYYSNSQIQKHLRCSAHTAVDTVKELERAGLIRREYQKNGLPIKIYVNDIRRGKSGTIFSVPETPQDKPLKKPYSNSFKHQKPYTNKISQEEKQLSFDATRTLSQVQNNRRNFGDVKLHKKKKED